MNMRFVTVFLLGLLIAAAAGHSASAQGKFGARYALVIGNAKYPDSDTPLKDAVNDAQALAKELRNSGFDVDVGENLKKDAMRTALEKLYGKIKSGSVALVFFSGYGIQSNRQSYMIPVDAQIWTEGDVRRDGFSVDAMLNQMNLRGAKIKIAILNASRRNPFERRFRPVASGLAPVIAPPDTMIMYSAAPGTVVSDSRADNSLFVTQLIKELRRTKVERRGSLHPYPAQHDARLARRTDSLVLVLLGRRVLLQPRGKAGHKDLECEARRRGQQASSPSRAGT